MRDPLHDLPRDAVDTARPDRAPEVEIVIEVPRGSFLKRGLTGRIDFVSPLPCPFNYGAVPSHLGLEGDLLDALVLGPRLRFGTRVRLRAWGAVTLTDRGMSDDKLVCSAAAAEPRGMRRGAALLPLLRALQGLAQFRQAPPGSQRVRGMVRGGRRDRPRTTVARAVERIAGSVLNARRGGVGRASRCAMAGKQRGCQPRQPRPAPCQDRS